MDLQLEGKAGIVWGASQGIGKAIARELLAEGMDLVVLARRADRLHTACEELGLLGTVRAEVGDIRNLSDIERAVAAATGAYGRLDVVVNNDGAPPVGPIVDFSDDDWSAAIERNFLSVVRSVRASLPLMRAGTGGSIVNITALSVLQPLAGLGLSVATWAAVAGYAKTLSIECGRDGIRINTICPGRIDTPRVALVSRQRAESVGTEHGPDPAAEVPLGRLGDPAEVAALAAFLSSPRSSFMTGATLTVDGGSRRSLF